MPAPFASPDGKENYLNNAFETVFDVYEGIAQEFQNPTRQLFSSYFELLFPADKAENVKDQTGGKPVSQLASYAEVN